MLSYHLQRISTLGRTASLLGRSDSQCIFRGIATGTKAVESKKLPLAGVRVLDMSRVLAGVSINAEVCLEARIWADTQTAILHTNSG